MHDHNAQPDSIRCTHLDASLRRCRQLIGTTHPNLCAQHATAALQAAEAARLNAALTEPAPDLKTPADINRVLAQLFSAVSTKKVDLRQGALLAYIAQLMLRTNKLANPSHTHPTTLPCPPLAE
jgi:hypothetical protein